MSAKRGIANYFLSAKKPKLDVPEHAQTDMDDKVMKIVSWNVAGLHSVVKKNFCESVKKLDPDILCIQETKTSLKKQPPSEISEKLKLWKFRYYFDSTTKNGYSGTYGFSKKNVFLRIYFYSFNNYFGSQIAVYGKLFYFSKIKPNLKIAF